MDTTQPIPRLRVVVPAGPEHDVYLADEEDTPYAILFGGEAEHLAIGQRLADGWNASLETPKKEQAAPTTQAELLPIVLGALEEAFIKFGDHRMVWPGSATPAGQALLGKMCDAIATATGRTPQDVRNDYSRRAGARGDSA